MFTHFGCTYDIAGCYLLQMNYYLTSKMLNCNEKLCMYMSSHTCHQTVGREIIPPGNQTQELQVVINSTIH